MKPNNKKHISLNFIYFLVGTLLGLTLVNKYGWGYLQNWRAEYNDYVTNYLRILFSFPAVLLIVMFVFFSKFFSAIDYFIRNMKVKYKDVEASSQQGNTYPADNPFPNNEDDLKSVNLSSQDSQEIAESIEQLQNDNSTKDQEIIELRNLVTQLAGRSEFFEFKYLNEVLVLNTKFALKNLYLIGPISRDSFIRDTIVSTAVVDKYSEQLAIHSALLVNGLIEESGSLIKTSEKGERYLKFIGLI